MDAHRRTRAEALQAIRDAAIELGYAYVAGLTDEDIEQLVLQTADHLARVRQGRASKTELKEAVQALLQYWCEDEA